MPNKIPKKAMLKTPLAILSILAAVVLVAVLLNKDYIVGVIPDKESRKERQELQEKVTVLEKEIKELTTPPPPPVSEVTEEELPPPPAMALGNMTCQELDAEIQKFFSYLDSQQYMAGYDLKDGSQAHFKQLVDKLLMNPPIVVRETDSLFTILTNTAHFYRVLGKDNVLMLRDIIIREADILEPTFALFDQWSQTGAQCPTARTDIQLPLAKLYEYAGFFLNTLGGQAYLFRRNTHIRLLIKYYCIMVLDRANAEVVNRHGIDITPPLESLINEMEISETMVYKEQYLRKLRELRNKYQAHYEN
jgi:hypothetical protein